MLRKYAFLWRNLFILVDLSISAGVFLAAYWLRFQPPLSSWLKEYAERPPLGAYLEAVPLIGVLLFVTNSYFRLYQPRRVSHFLDELADLIKSSAMALVLLMTIFFLHRGFSYSRPIVLIFAVLNPLALFFFRLGIRSTLRWLRSHGYNSRSVLIIGTGRPAQALLHRFQRNLWTGIRVRGFVCTTAERVGSSLHGIPVVGTTGEIRKLVEELAVEQVFIALPLEERRAIEELLEELAGSFVAVRLVPELGLLFQHRSTTDFDGLRIVNLWEDHLGGWHIVSKRALDLLVASVGLVALAPFFLIIGALIKLTSTGPVFHRQQRMGLDGRLFPMLKFRSMQAGTENDGHFTRPGDERCTRVGRFLRRTSLDELPQLLNVIIGQMSLVGPRPERPVFIKRFSQTLPRYMLRHKVKAGMTGWAQIHGWRGDSSLKKRLQYDLYYLYNWSLWLDIKILLITLVRGWTHRNAY